MLEMQSITFQVRYLPQTRITSAGSYWTAVSSYTIIACHLIAFLYSCLLGTCLCKSNIKLSHPYVHIWCLRISGIYQGIILCIKQSCCIAREILDFLRCKEWLIYDCKSKTSETPKHDMLFYDIKWSFWSLTSKFIVKKKTIKKLCNLT